MVAFPLELFLVVGFLVLLLVLDFDDVFLRDTLVVVLFLAVFFRVWHGAAKEKARNISNSASLFIKPFISTI